MAFLNRYGILVRPKTRYVEWANSCREDEPELTIDEARTNPSVYLIAPVLEDEDVPNPRQLLAARATEIFEEELGKWNPDGSTWPANRSPHAFQAWFDAEVVMEVVDLSGDVPMVSMMDDEAADYALEHCAWCGGHLYQDDVRLVPYSPLADVEPGQRSVPVELDAEGERIVFAIRADEFELAGVADVEGDEEDGLDIVEDAIEAEVDAADVDDEGLDRDYDDEDDDGDFVLACCSDKCQREVEAALEARYRDDD